MNDKYDFKELIGARLEEIHLAESLPEKMPSDEDILRWETLANARLSARKRKRKQLLSIAAVLLLAVVISVAAIVAPPDAEAGGEGKAVLVENGNGMIVVEYRSIKEIPTEVKEKFIVINDEGNELVVKNIIYTKSKNAEQIEIKYIYNEHEQIVLTETKSEETILLESESNYTRKKEIWNGREIYIMEDPNRKNERNYMFVYDNVYVLLYAQKDNEHIIKRIIKEAF